VGAVFPATMSKEELGVLLVREITTVLQFVPPTAGERDNYSVAICSPNIAAIDRVFTATILTI